MPKQKEPLTKDQVVDGFKNLSLEDQVIAILEIKEVIYQLEKKNQEQASLLLSIKGDKK